MVQPITSPKPSENWSGIQMPSKMSENRSGIQIPLKTAMALCYSKQYKGTFSE